MRSLRPVLPALFVGLALTLAVGAPVTAAETPWTIEVPLPPLADWDGASRELVVGADDPWQTPAEASGLTTSPSYAETMAWLDRLAQATPLIRLVDLGTSAEGREIRMAIVTAEGVGTPEALHASGKPVLLAHAGIHSGEIDGKDAGMMLLRDLTVGGSQSGLLQHASFLFVPILNVDGHERASRWSRPNQRGPETMGWRTNGRNLNLNRDFAKLDTAELRALIAAMGTWRPDLYIDLHVTDGADYQYDITWGHNGAHAWSGRQNTWLAERFDTAVASALAAQGHVPGPLVFGIDRFDLSQGLVGWTAGPRYSNGYGDARHLATILVENHSLKPFDRRVLGTYVLLRTALDVLGEHGDELRLAATADRGQRLDTVPLGWSVDREATPRTIRYLGIEQKVRDSDITGGQVREFTGEPIEMDLPVLDQTLASASVARAPAYWVPATRPEIVERLEAHGIAVERLTEPREMTVEMYRLGEPKIDTEPFEGRFRVTAPVTTERRTAIWPVGSARVSTDQPLGTLATLLLEPESPDSFFQWGFFHEILQRTEYMAGYALEPLARRMLEEDPELAEEFAARVASDEAFAGDQRARLRWFYERTPYFDVQWRLYPIGREIAAP